jgi:16S rRNA (guanine966-N2)-methyltransferase
VIRKARPHGGPPGEVRLIGGQWKRSKLPVADRPGLRPTPDRVRETLFNWLGQDLTGWRVLDAFAGTGALGFEAASRGAAEVLLLERDAILVRGLSDVKARLKADVVQVQAANAMAWLKRCSPGRFELVMLDPPFDASVFETALTAAAPTVAPGGFIYLEAPREFDTAPAGFALHRHLRAGAVHAHLFVRAQG